MASGSAPEAIFRMLEKGGSLRKKVRELLDKPITHVL